ncbi:MAG: sigma 54-interacting transcriptional regulator [Desulfovibrionaceae bacterium]|nr:sigma 54-interacting transcriptional regulator [Desulfovibrionaceae bacterium]
MFFLPIPLIGTIVIFAVTHQDVESTLSDSVAQNSYIQAHGMGYALSQTLVDKITLLAALASGTASLADLRRRLRRRLEALMELGDMRFREAAFSGTGSEANERYLWISDNGEIIDFPAQQVDSLTNSPFHFKRLPKENEVLLSQPTEVTYALSTGANNKPELQVSMQVMRFITPVILTDGTFAGYLILSVDLSILRETIAAFAIRQEPNEQAPLVLFVDNNGWMIFQMELNGTSSPMPVDSVRSGLRGDFGRAGFGQAFRPKADYYGYWEMMNRIRDDSSGYFFTSELAWNEGSQIAETISYATVNYASSKGSKPEVLGGVVILEPSFFSTRLGEDLRKVYLACFLALLGLMSVSIFWIGRSLRRSVLQLRDDIASASAQSLSTGLPERDEPAELRGVRGAVNEVLAQKRTLEDERDMQDSLTLARVQQEEVPNMPKLIERPEDGLIGVSREMTQMRQDIQRAANSQVDVLIMGETGTGKELTSRAVHNLSDRRAGPFITINCGALDESLLMDTLFGHVKGAYTEAKQGRKGAFLTAEGGTLMLDEIGTASAKVQTALLRALSERCIYPLGSDTKIPFNTRVIAATNADLREEVAKGNFREDLYFRLAVITIRTPPLRQRKMDIPYLIMAFLQQAMEESGRLRRAPAISKGALSQLMHYHWPGNIRELKNVISRALAFCEGDIILPLHLRLGDQADKPEEHSVQVAEEARKAVRAARSSSRPDDSGSAPSSIPPFADAETPARAPETAEKASSAPVETGAESPAEEGVARSDSAAGKSSRVLSGRLQRILPQLRSLGSFSRQEYQAIAEVSMRTAQYDLQELVSSGLAERKGKGPSQRYIMQDGSAQS